MTYYGQDYMLEDKTGWLTGSDYDDIHDANVSLKMHTARTNPYRLHDLWTARARPFLIINNLLLCWSSVQKHFGTVSFQTGVRIPMSIILSGFLRWTGGAVDPVCMINIYLRVSKLQISHAKVRSTGWATVSVALAHQT